MKLKTFIQLAFVVCLGCSRPVLAQPAAPLPAGIGTVTFVVGEVRLEREGKQQPLIKGQSLQTGDRLHTGPDGHIHARMVDDGFISVRPASRLHIQQYTYVPGDPSANRVGLLLESGVSRTISGKAGETARERYRFNTPVAAIGLRGTDYVVQALPELTRVTVLKGAVTLSPLGPGCLASALAPCSGPQALELAAAVPHAYMEVRAKGGPPVIVPPDNNKDAPNKLAPPRNEEISGLAERQLTAKRAIETLRPVVLSPEQRPDIEWGRWSNVSLPNTPTVASLFTDGREITFGNSLFGLFRPDVTPQLPSTGVINMNYVRGDAYLQQAGTVGSAGLVAVPLSNGQLQLDFNARQFATGLTAALPGSTLVLHAQGDIQFQGMLNADPARSNMNLAGVLSNNAKEAGYLFDMSPQPGQTLVGATRWKR